LGTVCEDEDPLQRDEALEAAESLLEEGLFSQKFDQVLRRGGTADWPEAFPASPSHDEDKEAVEG
jgi:hypothetical protein